MTKMIATAGHKAALKGYGLQKWVNDKTPGSSAVVLTDTTLVYNLAEGDKVMITCMCFDLETASDNCHFIMVSCDAVDGGGNATEISGHVHVHTPAAKTDSQSRERHFIPPIYIPYSGGVRSITMKVDANDASAAISCGWMGYVSIAT